MPINKKKTHVIDYTQTEKPEAPALNYQDFNKIPKKPEAPALNYQDFNKIPKKPEAPALDYGKMKTPYSGDSWKQDAKLNKKRIKNVFMSQNKELMVKGET
jgi:hypothetical protein